MSFHKVKIVKSKKKLIFKKKLTENLIDENNAVKSEFDQSKPANKTVRFASGIIIKAGNRFNDYSYVKPAIQINRTLGVKGEVYFFYEGLFEQNGFLADSLLLNHYHM